MSFVRKQCSEALKSMLTGLRRDFAGFIERSYPGWVSHPDADRPALDRALRSHSLMRGGQGGIDDLRVAELLRQLDARGNADAIGPDLEVLGPHAEGDLRSPRDFRRIERDAKPVRPVDAQAHPARALA